MHELSIAVSIVDYALEEAQQRSVRVLAIPHNVGAIAGVVREALEGSYDLVTAGTALEGSKLVIREMPVTIYCPECKETRELPSIQHFACPSCGTLVRDILEGKELQVTALEVEG